MDKNTRISNKERKYCSCLMKVRAKQYKPYGICYKSVLKGVNPRPGQVIPCSVNYNFNKYTRKMLDAYANEKKIPLVYLKGTKKGRIVNRQTLIRRLNTYKNQKKQSYLNKIKKKKN